MRTLVAGATGAIGRQLIPMLVSAGHDVVGTTRRPERARWLEHAGATARLLDAFDGPAVTRLLLETRPEVLIHQLTDLARGFRPEDLAGTARVREVGTRHLIDASLAAGTGRVVAQSGAWLYADGPQPHTEDQPLSAPTEAEEDQALRGITELERLVMRTPGIDGTVLRYGFLYGANTAWDRDSAPRPRVGVVAAARAALLAAERAASGAFNIVDDDPAISNRRARDVLGWSPD